jgi:hypothetical protein
LSWNLRSIPGLIACHSFLSLVSVSIATRCDQVRLLWPLPRGCCPPVC